MADDPEHPQNPEPDPEPPPDPPEPCDPVEGLLDPLHVWESGVLAAQAKRLVDQIGDVRTLTVDSLTTQIDVLTRWRDALRG